MSKIKNRITIARQPNGLYSVTHFTFDNGRTVWHDVTTDLTRDEARNLKKELLDL